MKFTSKDLMKAMKLQVGDKIKFYNEVFTIVEMPNNVGFENDMGCYNIDVLLNKDFEILPRPKRVGDTECGVGNCKGCPLGWLCDTNNATFETDDCTLYDILEKFKITDQEIYDLLKARLDKEVSE